jgi:purine-binding chemotaxis protein CheW
MSANAFAIFTLHEMAYGALANAVSEVFYLPELTPIAESPPDVVGVLDWRGTVLPIIDLDLRFGHHQNGDYHLSNCVVVLQSGEHFLGVIVDSVRDVVLIDDQDIERNLSFGRTRSTPAHNGHGPESAVSPASSSLTGSPQSDRRLIWGLARLSSETIALIDPEVAIYQTATFEWEELDPHHPLPEAPESPVVRERSHRFCAHFTPEERKILQDRTNRLRSRTNQQQDAQNTLALAVVAMGGEYLAVPLEATCEFIQVRKVSPVPCCPPHIVGNMNLRGEIVTLLDLSTVLDLSQPAPGGARMAIVVDVQGMVAGLVVESVLDIAHVSQQAIAPVPEAIHNNNREYLRGVVPYAKRSIGIVNLEKVFLQGGLIVDEVIA